MLREILVYRVSKAIIFTKFRIDYLEIYDKNTTFLKNRLEQLENKFKLLVA